MKGSVFPYKVRVKDPDVDILFKRLAKDRSVHLHSGNLHKFKWKIKPIRKSLFIGEDYRYKKNKCVSLPPGMILEQEKKYYIFKWK